MVNPYAQYVDPKVQGEPGGNPYMQFISGPTISPEEAEVLSAVNNVKATTPVNFGLSAAPETPVELIHETYKDVLKQIGIGAAKFAGSLATAGAVSAEAVGELGQQATGTTMAELPDRVNKGDLPTVTETGFLALDYAGKQLRQRIGEYMGEAFGPRPDGWRGFIQDTGSVGGGILGTISTTMITRNPAYAAEMFALIQGTQTYEQARQSGYTPAEAFSIGLGTGAATGLIEAYGLKGFGALATSAPVKRVLIRIAGQGAEEAGQQAATDIIHRTTGIENMTNEEMVNDILYSGLLGMVGGAPVVTVVSIMEERGKALGMPEGEVQQLVKRFMENQGDLESAVAEVVMRETSDAANYSADRKRVNEVVNNLMAQEEAQADPEALTMEERQYLNEFLNEEERAALAESGVDIKPERPQAERIKKPVSIAEFVRRRGGFRDEGQDIRSVMGGNMRPGLVSSKGMTADDMALAAWEAGYINTPNRPTVNDFLNTLTEDLRGNAQVPLREISDKLAYDSELARNSEIDELVGRFEIQTEGKTRGQVLSELAGRVAENDSRQQFDAENLERQEAAQAEIDYWERKERDWLLSRGDAWEASQPDTRTLEDLENEYRQEKIVADLFQGKGPADAGGPAATDSQGVRDGKGQGGGGAAAGRGRKRQGQLDRRALYEEVLRTTRGESIGSKASKIGEDARRMTEAALAPISTRLENINPTLKSRLRKFEFDLRQRVNDDQRKIEPFLRRFQKLPQTDRALLDFAMMNGDADVVARIAGKHNMEADIDAVREVLDGIYQRADKMGLDVSYRENYFPRMVSEPEKLLQHFRGKDGWGRISEALRSKEIELGRFLSEPEKAELINTTLRGYGSAQIALSKPANTKERRIETVTPDILNYYASTDQAILRYVGGMNANIESRRFFGRNGPASVYDNIDDSIGWFVKEELAAGRLKPSQEEELISILQARFKQGRMGAFWRTYKNVEYISTMGSPLSAITQLGDLAFSMYKNGVYRTGQALLTKSRVTREDIGVEEIAQEFTDPGTTGKALRRIFKIVGFDKMDALGKETLINGALLRYQKQAKRSNAAFRESLEIMFGEETGQVIDDLKAGRVSENVQLLLFNELLDMQPVALSEMPEYYLRAGNGRVLYMLKTFTIKQLDVYRREVFREMRTNPVQGTKNLVRLLSFFILMNAGADFLKDLLLGRETPIEDHVANNLFRAAGISKYQVYTARRDGFGKAAFSTVAPPFSVVDRGFKDFNRLIDKGELDPEKMQSVQNVPVVGKFYYWWMGAGK